MTLTKSHLIDAIAEQNGFTQKKSSETVETILTLVNYIKRLLADKLVPMGEDGVTVCHFYELCGDIIGYPRIIDQREPTI